MRLFGLFKSRKEQQNTKTEDQISEIMNCYNGFFEDLRDLLLKAKDSQARAILIGQEIPTIARYDLDNFNTLLHNNFKSELGKKTSVFFQEQSTFYVLFSDRYLFSHFGSSKRDLIMDDLENGYLNRMMNLAGNEEKFWHHSRKIIQEREQESNQCESVDHFLRFHKAKLIEKLDLKEDYAMVRVLMEPIITAGTMMFSMKMLNELNNA